MTALAIFTTTARMECAVASVSDHYALDCIHSWYRRPQTVDPGNDPAAGDPEDALDGRPVGDGPPPLEEVREDIPAASHENASLQATDNSAAALSSAEVHVLDFQGLVLPNTPHADEVLDDLFASNDEGVDGEDGEKGEFSTADDDDDLETEEEDPESDDTETEASKTPSLTENAALAAVFKNTRKNVKKRLGDTLPLLLGRPPDLPLSPP